MRHIRWTKSYNVITIGYDTRQMTRLIQQLM